MEHRKLFQPITTNQSLVCPDVCDSDCPYDCYPYPDTYALPPPPIPQQLLPPPPPTKLSSHNISPYIIIASTFFGITLLLIIYYIIFIKNCFRSNSNDQDDSDSDSSNDIRLPTTDHPIWYIRTVGLQPSIINSITVFNFNKGDSLIDGTDCSICLNEFQEGELLRLLPKCNHAFHIPCIDTWLRSHTTCPVCRAGIVVVSAPTCFPPTAQNHVIPVEITESSEPEDSNNNENLENVDIQAESSSGLEIQDSGVNREKLVKRCVSADSFPMSMIKLEIVNLQVNGENQESPFNQRKDICSTSRIHQRINEAAPSSYRDVRVKRSFSYGGRSFLSRLPQNANLVLPL
ncbi:hypothetical protein Leryth_024056 [Lithospermum erythrorhizon]|nr:hypothetical protein Leryth_024056 [Lithospermum erythrorhizon]